LLAPANRITLKRSSGRRPASSLRMSSLDTSPIQTNSL
jgi:hypothetical protein